MKTIRLGLSATLSGNLSLQGIESFNGLSLWAEFQNSLGGIYVKGIGSNLPVELVFFNDESNVEKTAQITSRLINEENIDLLLGPYSSSLSLASAKVAEESGRVLWNYGGSTDEILSDDYSNTVTFITPASRYFEPYLDFLKNMHTGDLNIGVVYAEDSGFSCRVAGGAVRFCEENNISHKIFTYKSGSDEFSAITDRIRKDSIKAVIGVGRFQDDLTFASYLGGFNACLPGAGIEEFKIKLGKDSEGFCSVSQWEPGINIVPDFGIDSASFTELYSGRFGKIPDYIPAQSFNIGNILTHFIETIGTVDEFRLRDEIVNSGFNTFYGNFSVGLTNKTQAGHNTVATQWQNGRKEIIYPPEHATSEYIWPL